MSDNNATNNETTNDFATPERKALAYEKGYSWGYEFQEVDHEGAWGFDGSLMASYLDGCRAGSRDSKNGTPHHVTEIVWRRRE